MLSITSYRHTAIHHSPVGISLPIIIVGVSSKETAVSFLSK